MFKVALMGASGTGKSTLARYLSDKYGVGLLPENWVAIIETYQKLYFAEEPFKQARLMELLERFDDWVANRISTQQPEQGFVADRTALDFLGIYLLGMSGEQLNNDEVVKSFLSICAQEAKRYELIVVLPLTQTAFTAEANEDGLMRSTSLGKKVREQAMLCGLVSTLSPTPYLMLPAGATTVEQRADLIVRTLQNMQARSAPTQTSA